MSAHCLLMGLLHSKMEKFLINVAFHYFLTKRVKGKQISNRPRLIWGVTPILNFKYWNDAMKAIGYSSESFMSGYYGSINKRSDFDFYFDQVPVPFFLKVVRKLLPRYRSLARIHLLFFIASKSDIIHTTYDGLIWADTKFWREELEFYRKGRLKFVVLPYGSDYQMYSKLYNKSWHHALLMNYPEGVKREKVIREKIDYFVEHADCIMAGFQFDQIARWDILPYAVYPMNTDLWKPKIKYNNADGKNGVVKVYHTPNHRGAKGTEFLVKAVEELQAEGLLVELCLLEKMQNDKVREILFLDADILVEQLILGFALSALEGMATGLPVISNLEEDENQIKVFRRFSYLNECPIFSSNPEKIKSSLRRLITQPELRKQLGESGVKYVEKYHSYKAMGEIFGAIYDRIWYGKEVDLLNFFNPNDKESFNNRYPFIEHPLQRKD